MKTSEKLYFAFGVILSLFAGSMMWNGHILGEDAIEIARVLGMVAVCIIATGPGIMRKRRDESEEA